MQAKPDVAARTRQSGVTLRCRHVVASSVCHSVHRRWFDAHGGGVLPNLVFPLRKGMPDDAGVVDQHDFPMVALDPVYEELASWTFHLERQDLVL